MLAVMSGALSRRTQASTDTHEDGSATNKHPQCSTPLRTSSNKTSGVVTSDLSVGRGSGCRNVSGGDAPRASDASHGEVQQLSMETVFNVLDCIHVWIQRRWKEEASSKKTKTTAFVPSEPLQQVGN